MKREQSSIKLDKGLRLFRAKYRTDDGKLKVVDSWYLEFRDHEGRPRRIPAFNDREQSAELARKIRKLVAWKVSGELPDASLSRWIETMPDKLRDRLAEIDLLDARRVAASKPISLHLDDWKAALLAKGNTPAHAELVTRRARKVFEGCGFVTWMDISGSALMEYLADMRKPVKGKQGISAQTFNFYLQAVKQFSRWMVKDRRASESALSHLDGLNVRTDRRHDRRAFSVEELQQLLQTTAAGPVRFNIPGRDRAILYRMAAETGFRRGELASLTKQSFELGDEPGVIVSAAYAKARRERRVALRADFTAELAEYLRHKLPDAPAFRVPSHGHSAKLVKMDLEAARAEWIEAAGTPDERERREKSNFCKYRDDAGRCLDFHAFRHTRGVWLFEHHKAHPREVQEIMGVSSLTLVDRYTRSFRISDPNIMERGPALSIPSETQTNELRATGTDGQKTGPENLACFLAHFGGKSGDGRQNGSTNTQAAESKKTLINQGFLKRRGGES